MLIIGAGLNNMQTPTRKLFKTLALDDRRRRDVSTHYKLGQTLVHVLSIELSSWVVILFSVVIVALTWQLFCTVLCPAQCGVFTTTIAVLAFVMETLGIKLTCALSSDIMEISSHAMETFKEQKLSPLETRVVNSFKYFSLSLGPFAALNRKKFPFIMREVVFANAIDLILTFR